MALPTVMSHTHSHFERRGLAFKQGQQTKNEIARFREPKLGHFYSFDLKNRNRAISKNKIVAIDMFCHRAEGGRVWRMCCFDTKSLGGNKKKRPFEKHTENTGLLLCYPFISISISLNW